jgi:hypothetical protein
MPPKKLVIKPLTRTQQLPRGRAYANLSTMLCAPASPPAPALPLPVRPRAVSYIVT